MNKKFKSFAVIAIITVTVLVLAGCFTVGNSEWFYTNKSDTTQNSSSNSGSSNSGSSNNGSSSSGSSNSGSSDSGSSGSESSGSGSSDSGSSGSGSSNSGSSGSSSDDDSVIIDAPTGDVTSDEKISSTPKTKTLNAKEIYAENVTSVVGIKTESTTTNIFGQTTSMAASGTGIILTEDGYILTNNHVIEDGDTYTVTLYTGDSYEAVLVGTDTSNDVAVLKINATGLNPAELADSDALIVGSDVYVIGNPLGELTYTMTRGIVSALNRQINSDGIPINMFQIDAAVNSGNSGGPCFDEYGNVIGMVTAKASTSSSSATVEGLGFCIPINDAREIANQLINYGYVLGKAALKIGVTDAYSRTMWGSYKVSGAYVTYVADGSAAANAGLKVDSLITSFGGYSITSADDLITAIKLFSAGDTVEISGTYNSSSFTITVTLDEYTPSIEPSGWSTSNGTVI